MFDAPDDSAVDSFDALFGDHPSCSGLDLPLTLTTFRSVRDTNGSEARLSLRELAARIGAVKAEAKESLPLLLLARLGQDRGEGVSRRNAANVVEVFGVEGDHDAGTMSLQEARERLSSAGVAALLYSTPSSRPENPRWRVLAPTSAGIEPEARRELIDRLNAVLAGALAPESWRLAQAYYFGHVTGSAAVETALVEGRPIDHVPAGPTAPPPDMGRCSDDELLADIAAGRSFHQPLTSLIGRWLRRAVTPEECQQRAKDAMEAVPAADRDHRWRQRMRDIPRLVRDIAKREAHRESVEIENLADEFDDLPDAPRASRGLRLLRPGDCAAAPRRGYLVKGLLAPRDVGCIYGAPGTGKSLLTPLIAYHVAQGEPVLGLRTRQGPVLYVAAEDPHGMADRVTALRQLHGDAGDFILVDGVSDLLLQGGNDLRELGALVGELNPVLVVIDTLAAAFPGLEENSAEAMGRVVAVARKLTAHGAAVILIHHDTKQGTPTPRGHSLLNGALDVALQLVKDDETGIVRARFSKNRNGRSDREFAFRIASEILGTDEDGDAITAPVANPISEPLSKRRPKLSPSERAALKILKNSSDALGRMPEDNLRRACVDGRSVSASDDPESRRKAVKRAFEGLARKGYARFADGDAQLVSLDFGDDESGLAAAFDDLLDQRQ